MPRPYPFNTLRTLSFTAAIAGLAAGTAASFATGCTAPWLPTVPDGFALPREPFGHRPGHFTMKSSSRSSGTSTSLAATLPCTEMPASYTDLAQAHLTPLR